MKFRIILPVIYAVIAIGFWINFLSLPPDGLASIGLMLVVLPITLLDLSLRPESSPGTSIFIPSQFGYYTDHAIFYGASVLIIGLALILIGFVIDRRRSQPTAAGN